MSEADRPAIVPLRDRLILSACMFLSVAAFGFLEPFVPLYLELSGLSRGQIGLVSGLGTGAALLIQPLLGRVSDRLDARRPLMFGAAVAAGGAYLLYRHVESLALFVLLTTVGINGVIYLNTATGVLVGRLVSRGGGGQSSRGAGTFASFRVWGSLGYVTVALVTGVLLGRSLGGGSGAMTRASLSPLFLYGPLLFFAIAAVVWFAPDPKKDASAAVAASDDGAAPADHDEAEPTACDRNLNRFLRSQFLFIFAYAGSVAYLSLFLKGLGATPFSITAVFAAGVLCEAAVMTQAGRLSDRFGRRPLIAVAFLFLPVRLLLYIPATGPIWVLGVQTIHGINFGVMAALAVAFVNDLCTEHNRGALQARLAGVGGLAAALGPAAGGLISQRLGLGANFAIMSGIAALGAALFVWKVRESLPSRTPLYRRGSGSLRAVLAVLSIPAGRLTRRGKPQNHSERS